MFLGFALGAATATAVAMAVRTKAHKDNDLDVELAGMDVPVEDIRNGLEECIGNTPLVRIKCLSEVTGCEILGKCEVGLFLSPWSTIMILKDS